MEKTIQKIIKTEKEAQEILSSAMQKKALLEQTCENEASAIKQKLITKAQKEIAEKKESIAKDSQNKINAYHNEFELAKEKISGDILKCKDKLIDEIFCRITSV